MGQLASTRSDILPQPIVQELAKLQDQVRPLSFGVIRQVVEESLQTRLETAYQEFDPAPTLAFYVLDIAGGLSDDSGVLWFLTKRVFETKDLAI